MPHTVSTRGAESPILQLYGEHMSDTSPKAKGSLQDRSMRGGYGSGKRGARGGSRGGKNARRAHSISSGNSSNSQGSTNCSDQKWTFNPQFRAESPQSSDQDMQRNRQRPMLAGGAKNWAHSQEVKIKLYGIRKNYWTKEVYQAMSRYGNVFKIDMEPNSRDCNAFVVFRYVLNQHSKSGYLTLKSDPLLISLFHSKTYALVTESYGPSCATRFWLLFPVPQIPRSGTTNSTHSLRRGSILAQGSQTWPCLLCVPSRPRTFK